MPVWSILVILALAIAPATRAQDVEALIREARPAVVKLVVSGSGRDEKPKADAGSGFFVLSKADWGFSLIVTAAHVIGRPEAWLADPNGQPTREIVVHRVDSNGALVPHPRGATVLAEDAARDVAVLAIDGAGFKTLPFGEPFVDLKVGEEAILLGYGKDEFVASARPGKKDQTEVQQFGLVLRLNLVALAGQSGGPVLESGGKVVGIASYNRPKDAPQYHIAALVSWARTIIESGGIVLDSPSMSAVSGDEVSAAASPLLQIDGRTGTARVSIGGTGGGGLADPEPVETGLGTPAELRGDGGERSQCEASSGRTISGAGARGLVRSVEMNGLAFEADLVAHGGHYRTAAVCVGGKPVGLTGHDTEARATAELHGTIDFQLATGTTPPQVVWQEMPSSGARVLLDAPGDNDETIPIAGSGARALPDSPNGLWRVRGEVRAEAHHAGAGNGPDQRTLRASLLVQPAQ